MAKKKYVCAGCNKCTEPCTVELSGDAGMTKDPAKLMHCGTWLEVLAEEDTNKEQLPRLTPEVFSLPQCPSWAKYAAVDFDGRAYWYDNKPRKSYGAWANETGYRAEQIGSHYDASDWENSLIERPVKKQLPKLTTEVFALPECPEWAQYAAVDSDGAAYWYAAKPELTRGYGGWVDGQNSKRIDLRYAASDWENSLIERPVKEQLPKLTPEVFSMPQCPSWAKYAAVDDDGFAYWYDTKPERVSSGWLSARERNPARWITHNGKKLIYDSSDWQNSLVKRLTKLTAEIFEHPECPADAVVAVVNASGTAAWGSCADIIATEHGAFMTADGGAYDTWTRIPGGACFDATDWQHSTVYRADTQPKSAEQEAPKLTYDVFSSTLNEWKYVHVQNGRAYAGCPEWARYAAVDESGTVYVYENKPMLLYTVWADNGGPYAVVCDADEQKIKFDASDWKSSLIERPAAAPKLTAGVFSLSECPEWARYAAVDADGQAYWYDAVPCLSTEWLRWDNGGRHARKICYAGEVATPLFDATDWKNSLIERPAVVPEWFKPGVLAYNSDIHTCFHVTDSTKYCENYLEAKVRPFNADELERKLAQFVRGPNGSKLLVTGFYPDGVVSGKPEICVLGDLWLNAEELLNWGSRPQGIQQYRSKEGIWIDCGLSS